MGKKIKSQQDADLEQLFLATNFLKEDGGQLAFVSTGDRARTNRVNNKKGSLGWILGCVSARANATARV